MRQLNLRLHTWSWSPALVLLSEQPLTDAANATSYAEARNNYDIVMSSGDCSGDGVEKNPEESRRLLEIAATRGNGRARGLLQQIIQTEMEKQHIQDRARKAGAQD